ncbi:MAG TPA: alpha-ketoacid dehydrogenase subunit beta [Anaerolineae bacterium]|nr:alpha-ketoacid dehydrogenase subunit beta [Anaerolineae bacterium]
MNVLQALNGSLHACMAESEQVYFLGEDILEPYGGAFKVAQGLSTTYPGRVITTPVSEAGIVGLGVGMALRGLKAVVEIMFGDFIALAADQIINHAAKLRWVSGEKVRVPLVIRTPMGGGRGYGPTHSQTLEKHFLGVPGLRVLAVTALDDPGGVLKSAILEDDDPVLFIEHKLLYAKPVISLVESSEFSLQRSGERYPVYHLTIAGSPPPMLTITAYGYMAELARQAVQRLAFEHEIFADLVIPTQLSPFSLDPLLESLAKTGRLLTLEEGSHTHGWGAEVLAHAVETHGPRLQAKRLAARDMPIPASGPLEKSVIPDVEGVIRAAREMIS